MASIGRREGRGEETTLFDCNNYTQGKELSCRCTLHCKLRGCEKKLNTTWSSRTGFTRCPRIRLHPLLCRLGEKQIKEIAKIKDVEEVRGRFWVHDIFVRYGRDSQGMNKVIGKTVRKMKGMTSTNTLIAFEEQGGKEFSDSTGLHGQ